jgi:serine/threonine protein kinase
MEMALRLSSETTDYEWKSAKQDLKDKESGTQLKASQVNILTHDFIKLGNEIYAIDEVILGRGVYGKVLLVQNERKEVFVCKFTFSEKEYGEVPFPGNLFKRMGFIKNVNPLNAFEQATLHGLNLAVNSTYQCQHKRHITVMKYLGIPLVEYCKHRKLSEREIYHLAAQVVCALYDFHTGLYDENKQGRLHNDIKPANVLICPETKAVSLIDFSECFDINPRGEYEPIKQYRHPRASSFEPFITAPEIQYQTGEWYQPWKQFSHTKRLLSIQSDLYLLASVLQVFAKKNKLIHHLCALMKHPCRHKRPTEPMLIVTLMLISGDFNSRFFLFKDTYEKALATLPGFDVLGVVHTAQAKALVVCLWVSDNKHHYFKKEILNIIFADAGLTDFLVKRYPLFFNKALNRAARKKHCFSIRCFLEKIENKVLLQA